MINNLLDDEKFIQTNKENIYKMLFYLIDKNIEFNIICHREFVKFEPNIPIKFESPIINFALGGYTFSSIVLNKEDISFHAGFGAENFESQLNVPLNAIMQILVENKAILINLSKPFKIQKSKSIFKAK